MKDHLGNVRSTVTSTLNAYKYLAMHNISTANIEELIFDNIPNVRDTKPGSTNPDDMAARLNGGEPDKRIGTAIMLRTNPGDFFTINVKAFYDGDYEQTDPPVSSEDMIASLMGTLLGGSTIGPKPLPVEGLPDNQAIIRNIFSDPSLPQQLEQIMAPSNNINAPKAHLNYLWFNDKMQLQAANSGSVQVVQAPGWNVVAPVGGSNGGWVSVTDPGISSPGVGFLVVYIDNQSIGKDVWFDNLSLNNYTSNVTEEDHYYPFGLTVNTFTSAVTKNPYKLTTKELESKFDLNYYDFKARQFDMQIGRWLSVDPKAEKRISLTPYNYCSNNPIIIIDPNGMTDFTLNKNTGDVKQIGEANDQADRILKTNKKGDQVQLDKKNNAKVAVDGIAQGILKDGMNLKDNTNFFPVGGDKQPSLNDVDAFALKLSGYIEKEVRGTYFSKDGGEGVSGVSIGGYHDASTTKAGNNGISIGGALKRIGQIDDFGKYKLYGFFHTHPTISSVNYDANDRFTASPDDYKTKSAELRSFPDANHYLLTEPKNYGDKYPAKESY